MNDIKNEDSNCSEYTLAFEGYFIKNDWDEWLYEWKKHHYHNKMMVYINGKKEKGEDIHIGAQEIKDHQNYVLMDSATSEIFLNRESLRRECVNIARNMRKTFEKNKRDLEDFKYDKELIGLKYSNIRKKVNFIQITVIFASTIITFLETMKDKLQLTDSIYMTISPILLSTYIGLALALSRFFKLDDHKEDLCKLDEAQAFVISGLRHRMRDIELLKPIYCDKNIDTRKSGWMGEEIEEINIEKLDTMNNHFNMIKRRIDDHCKDGLEEIISNCKQKFDLAMNLTEKVYFKNKLLRIQIDKIIVEGNKDLLNNEENKNLLRQHESRIKKESCCIWKYLFCYCYDCKYHYVNKDKSLKVINKLSLEIIKKKKELEQKQDVEMGGYETDEHSEPDNYLDLKEMEKKHRLRPISSTLTITEDKYDNAFKSYNTPSNGLISNKIKNAEL